MRSIWIGSLVAAVIMFALGFVFFGFAMGLALSPIDEASIAAAQAALGSSLPATGYYMIPMDEEAWMRGPSALIGYVAAGDAPSMAQAMTLGFLHFLVTALLIAFALRAIGGDPGRRARVAILFGVAAACFMHLGDGIWYGYGWRIPLFEFVADGVIFIVGGLILARWFTGGAESPT